MLTQELRQAVRDLSALLSVDLSIGSSGHYLIDSDTKLLIEQLSPIVESLNEALKHASDNNDIQIDIRKNTDLQAGELPGDLAVLLGYIEQLYSVLKLHWSIIKSTGAVYMHNDAILMSKICGNIANICSNIYYAGADRQRFHPYQFLITNFNKAFCLKSYNECHQLYEFILRNDEKTPIIVADFFRELLQVSGNIVWIKQRFGYEDDEINRLANHSEPAKNYFNCLVEKKNVMPARASFLSAMSNNNIKITSSYGEAGEKRLALNLFKYFSDAPTAVTSLQDKAKFILKYISPNHWQQYIEMIFEEQKDRDSVCELLYAEALQLDKYYSAEKSKAAIKLLRQTILKSPAEIADFMLKHVDRNEWNVFVAAANLKKPEIMQIVSILLHHESEAAWQDIINFAKNVIATPNDLAIFMLHYLYDDTKFKSLSNLFLSSSADQKECIKIMFQSKKFMSKSDLIHFLISMPKPTENFKFVLDLIDKKELFRLVLNSTDEELKLFTGLRIKLEAEFKALPEQPFIANELYQFGLFYILSYTYDCIRKELPDTLTVFGAVGSYLGSSANGKTAKMEAAEAFCKDIARMIEEDKFDWNLEKHDLIKPHADSFKAGGWWYYAGLWYLKDGFEKTGKLIVAEREGALRPAVASNG